MALPSTTADRFREVAAGFTAQVETVAADSWGAQTPCTEWKARDLVGHIVSWAGPALEDAGVDVTFTEDKNSDPAEAWRQFVTVAQAAAQVQRSGTPEQVAEAATELDAVRRRLYAILARE